jgi:hypothetical protein
MLKRYLRNARGGQRQAGRFLHVGVRQTSAYVPGEDATSEVSTMPPISIANFRNYVAQYRSDIVDTCESKHSWVKFYTANERGKQCFTYTYVDFILAIDVYDLFSGRR